MSLPIKLQLPTGFLDEEVRCGFTVTEKLKKIWAVELDLLAELLRVCKKHEIPIQVFGGTLLGTIRHHGFIPWDDDLDVALTRDGFEKLRQVADSEFKYPYFFQTALSDQKYFFAFGRLRNSETTAAVSGSDTPDYNNGIYIDVYVLEGYPPTRWLTRLQDFMIMCAVKPLTMYFRDKPKNKTLQERLMRLTRPVFKLLKYETLVCCHQRVLGFFTPFVSRVGLRDELSVQARRYWMYKDELRETEEAQFEMLKVPVTKFWDDVLKRLYGDYMRFPSASERGKWHEGMIRFDPDTSYKVSLDMKE